MNYFFCFSRSSKFCFVAILKAFLDVSIDVFNKLLGQLFVYQLLFQENKNILIGDSIISA